MDSDKNPTVLTINSGSSNLKFALFAIHEADTPDCLYRGNFTAIGNAGHFRVYDNRAGETDGAPVLARDISIADHAQALRILLDWLVEQQPALQLTAVGHRIVHGGRRLHAPVRITDDTLAYLNTLIPLAPNHQPAGLLGLSGESDDMATLLASASAPAHQAIEQFVHHTARAIGSLAATLGGLYALVFTGGIGEQAAPIREAICKRCEWLGLALDTDANQLNHTRISQDDSPVKARVIATDEESVIARHSLHVLELSNKGT